MLRPRALTLVLLASGLLAAACTGGGEDVPAANGSPSVSPTPGQDPGRATPTPSPASPVASPTRPEPAVVLVHDRFSPTLTFRSASGNLACRLWRGVICRATVHVWTSRAPRPQTECPASARTSGIQLTTSTLEERNDCYDQVEDPVEVLAYGHGVELDGLRCISEQRGITCIRTADRAGFSISRETLRHAPWESPLLHQAAETLSVGTTTVLPSGAQAAFRVENLADCYLAAALATCLVNSEASAPPGDPGCELDQSLTAEVSGSSAGELVYDCRSDANGAQDVLPAGEALQVGDLRCSVVAARLRCAHLGGGKHGFEVDRSSFRGF